jgi:ribosomal-protein-serine acetyltransferase
MFFLQVDEHIVLKILEMDDASVLFNLIEKNRAYLREWLPWIDTNTSLDDSKSFIQLTQEQHKQNLGFRCGIWLNNQLAGIVGFQHIDWMNRNVEIGYWLGENFQGLGIITKSCTILIDYAFHEYHLNRIQIRCATGNKKSSSAIERLGFKKEGIARQAEFLYDHYVDLFVYGMTADEWNLRNNAGAPLYA